MNSNENNKENNSTINNNIVFNNNNITIENKKKYKEDSSTYEDNRDSFVKMAEKKYEEDKIFEKGLFQFSKIEEKNEKSIESNKDRDDQININLDNANIEDLMNIIEIKNIENDGIIIEYNGEKGIFRGKLDDKNNICGKGKIHYKDGRIYEGIFENGKLNGEGKYISSNGDIYEGYFKNGILSGKGSIIKIKEVKNKTTSIDKEEDSRSNFNNEINKITYIGDIKDFKKEGKGKEECDDYKYEGNFHNDMKNGEGFVIYLKLGDKYKGSFKDDAITGRGTYTWKNGDIYEGDFIDGKMHGKGVYKWKEGSEYEGGYKNNLRDGKGIFKWKNGVIFEGNFINGKPEGKGEMRNINNNKKIEVEYKDGIFVGNLKEIMKQLN